MGICCFSKKHVIIEPTKHIRQTEADTIVEQTDPSVFLFKLDSFALRGRLLEDCYVQLRLEEEKVCSEKGVYIAEKKLTMWEFSWSSERVYRIKDLTKTMLTISLLHGGSKVYTVIKLDAYKVAKGPMHHNIFLGKNINKGCLSFNFKILQQTMVRVAADEVKCMLENPFGSDYSVHFKLLHHQEVDANHSAISSKPEWDFKDIQFTNHVPSLSFPGTIDDIRGASLTIRLYVRSNHTWKVAGECWKSFPTLLRAEFGTFQKETPFFKGYAKVCVDPGSIQARLDEDLLRNGKVVGSIKGSLWISNLPVLSQMITGVRTSENIELQSPNVVRSVDIKKVKLPRELLNLQLLTAQLTKFIASEANIEPFTQENGKLQEEHIKASNEVSLLLQRSNMTGCLCFTYGNIRELIKAQRILLELGEHLCEYCDSVPYSVRPYYFECMSHLIKRGELDLGSVSLNITNRKLYAPKESIARQYSELLISMLKFTLPKVDFRGSDKRVYQFIKLFMAIAYHRIPGFREKLIQVIQSKMWEDIGEWKRTEIYEFENRREGYLPMLNWKSLFYKYIPEYLQSRKLLMVLNDKKWQEAMSKRSIVYFYFVDEWAQHINRQFISKDIPWAEIPGYTILIKSFMLELKNRNILTYPEALIKASGSLLLNPTLLNPFLELIFKKANIYRYKTVLECFNVISYWLDSLWKNHRNLPFMFDSKLFLKGLKTALNDEVGVTVAKGLWLIYRHYHLFKGELRKIITDYLLENFDRLVFHWNPQVRKLLLFIMLFRIKSLREFSFQELTQMDHDIEKNVDHKLFPLRAGHSGPYFKLAMKEFKQCFETYQDWLVRVSYQHTSNKVYGPFDAFPYPEISVRVRTDKGERNLDELELNK